MIEVNQFDYLINKNFGINCGFIVNWKHILRAVKKTHQLMNKLPMCHYVKLQTKEIAPIMGSFFNEFLAEETGSVVNPCGEGFPDVLPNGAEKSSTKKLKNYPVGLELKTTIGNVRIRLFVRRPRIMDLRAITWTAHSRKVENLLGLVIDFIKLRKSNIYYPVITGVFYSSCLLTKDWGKYNEYLHGANTDGKCGLTKSGRQKMADNWVLVLKHGDYVRQYSKYIGCGGFTSQIEDMPQSDQCYIFNQDIPIIETKKTSQENLWSNSITGYPVTFQFFDAISC